MAGFFRVRFGVVQRSKGGSVVRRAAYQACTQLRSPDGREFDYSKNVSVHGHVRTFMMTPAGAPRWTASIQTCWSKATRAERRHDSQEGRTIEIALPHFLPQELWEPCARELLAPFVASGMVAQVSIHAKMSTSGVMNVHLHCTLTMRRLENDGFSAHKARDWNRIFRPATPLRHKLAAALTEFCARHGIDYTADARSNLERGLPTPAPILPHWNFLYAQRTGTPTRWLRELGDHRAVRMEIARLGQELAILEQRIREEEEELERRRSIRTAVFGQRRPNGTALPSRTPQRAKPATDDIPPLQTAIFDSEPAYSSSFAGPS